MEGIGRKCVKSEPTQVGRPQNLILLPFGIVPELKCRIPDIVKDCGSTRKGH
jgi:hypothetical protein